jgi:hypothetical protein
VVSTSDNYHLFTPLGRCGGGGRRKGKTHTNGDAHRENSKATDQQTGGVRNYHDTYTYFYSMKKKAHLANKKVSRKKKNRKESRKNQSIRPKQEK